MKNYVLAMAVVLVSGLSLFSGCTESGVTPAANSTPPAATPAAPPAATPSTPAANAAPTATSVAATPVAIAPPAPPARVPITPLGKPTIFVCGDSTSKFSGSETITSDMQGWGTPIATYFDSDKVKVNNVGQAGTSSMSYYNGNWPRVLGQIKPGDYVLIVFGINDGSTPKGIGDEVVPAGGRGGARGGAPGAAPGAGGAGAPAGGRAGAGGAAGGNHTYGWYMSKMATDVIEKDAHPYFLTVTTRNIWTNPKVTFKDATPTGPLPADYDPKQDKIERGTGNGEFTQWTKDVGKKIHVPVFDLTNYCADLYEKMGRETVDKMYRDHNHTHAVGADTVAKSIVSGLKAFKNSPFLAMLSDKGKAVTAADAKFIDDNLP